VTRRKSSRRKQAVFNGRRYHIGIEGKKISRCGDYWDVELSSNNWVIRFFDCGCDDPERASVTPRGEN
jgi:hypothetical protein